MAAQRSLADLYRVRESTEWYWRAIGTIAAGLVLLGFLVFPASFQSTTVDTAVDQSTLSIVAVVLLALGYSLSVALWFICRSWLFQLDVLFIPCLVSSVLGAINTGISISIRPATSPAWSPSSLSALSLAIASSIIYAGLCIFTWMRIRSARSRGMVVVSEVESDTDAQRKVWARLLSPRASDISGASSNTYRLDIPDHVRLGERAWGNGSTGSGSPVCSGSPETRAASTTLMGESSTLVPLTPAQLTPAAASLQQARERTLHNERSAARFNATLGQSQYGAQHEDKEELFAGAVHRPADAQQGYPEQEARFEVVNVPNFQIPLSQVRRRPEEPARVGELEARMAGAGRRR